MSFLIEIDLIFVHKCILNTYNYINDKGIFYSHKLIKIDRRG